MRDRFADRLAFKANVTDDVVRAKIREAAVQKQTSIAANTIPSFGHVTKAEKALIWSLIHEPEAAPAALAELGPSDLDGLASRSVLDLARILNSNRGFSPSVLLERLNMVEAQLVTAIASEPEPPALSLGSCIAIRRGRYERESSRAARGLLSCRRTEPPAVASSMHCSRRVIWAGSYRPCDIGGLILSIEEKYDEMRQLITVGKEKGACSTMR